MNIFQAMKQAKAVDSENKQEETAEVISMESDNSNVGVGFTSNGHSGLQPIQRGGWEIRDIDHDGIPDNMDYHFGPGQF